MFDEELGIVDELELEDDSHGIGKIKISMDTYEDKDVVIRMLDEENHVIGQFGEDKIINIYQFLKKHFERINEVNNMSIEEIINTKYELMQKCYKLEGELLDRTPLKKAYEGESTEKQIYFVKQLLYSNSYRLKKKNLLYIDKFESFCIIDVLHNKTEDLGIIEYFNALVEIIPPRKCAICKDIKDNALFVTHNTDICKKCYYNE